MVLAYGGLGFGGWARPTEVGDVQGGDAAGAAEAGPEVAGVGQCARCTHESHIMLTWSHLSCTCTAYCGEIAKCMMSGSPWGADLDVSKRTQYGVPVFEGGK